MPRRAPIAVQRIFPRLAVARAGRKHAQPEPIGVGQHHWSPGPSSLRCATCCGKAYKNLDATFSQTCSTCLRTNKTGVPQPLQTSG